MARSVLCPSILQNPLKWLLTLPLRLVLCLVFCLIAPIMLAVAMVVLPIAAAFGEIRVGR